MQKCPRLAFSLDLDKSELLLVLVNNARSTNSHTLVVEAKGESAETKLIQYLTVIIIIIIMEMFYIAHIQLSSKRFTIKIHGKSYISITYMFTHKAIHYTYMFSRLTSSSKVIFPLQLIIKTHQLQLK